MGADQSVSKTKLQTSPIFSEDDVQRFLHRLRISDVPPFSATIIKIGDILPFFPVALQSYAAAILCLFLKTAAPFNSKHETGETKEKNKKWLLHLHHHTTVYASAEDMLSLNHFLRHLSIFAINSEAQTDEIYRMYFTAFETHTKLQQIPCWWDGESPWSLWKFPSNDALNPSPPSENTESTLSSQKISVDSKLLQIVMHFLIYSYLETLFYQCVRRSYWQFKANEATQESEESIEGQQQTSENYDESFTLVLKLLNKIPSEKQLSLQLTSLLASFVFYYHTSTIKEDSYQVIIQWLNETLPLLSSTCSTAFVAHLTDPLFENTNVPLIPAKKLLKYQLYKQKPTKEKKSNKPVHSSSILPLINESFGLKGFWTKNTSHCLTDELCFALRQTAVEFQHYRWVRLFASWKNGISFAALTNCILFYPAPTIVIVKTSTGIIFGGTTFTPWKESGKNYFGSSKSFLFSASPRFHIFRSCGPRESFVYFNSKLKFSPLGFGFGGQTELFRLWIDQDLSQCSVTKHDTSYTAGDLCSASWNAVRSTSEAFHESSESFQTDLKIENVEVWGTGGVAALSEQQDARDLQEQIRQEKRTVDTSRLMESEFNKEFLFGNTFSRAKGPDGFST